MNDDFMEYIPNEDLLSFVSIISFYSEYCGREWHLIERCCIDVKEGLSAEYALYWI